MTLAEANRIIHTGSYDQALLDEALAVRQAALITPVAVVKPRHSIFSMFKKGNK
jgi:hypothetical protein